MRPGASSPQFLLEEGREPGKPQHEDEVGDNRRPKAGALVAGLVFLVTKSFLGFSWRAFNAGLREFGDAPVDVNPDPPPAVSIARTQQESGLDPDFRLSRRATFRRVAAMPGQLSLAGLDPASSPTDRLFLGIFPDASPAARSAGLAQRLRDEHRLRGRLLATDRLHITLHLVGDHHGLPKDVVAKASEAAGPIAGPPFEVTVDRVGSFTGRAHNLPLVLRGGGGLAALREFQGRLCASLQRFGLARRAGSNFTPHVTLLYDDCNVIEHQVEAVSWTVREFVLIHSLLGQTRHIALARWSVRG